MEVTWPFQPALQSKGIMVKKATDGTHLTFEQSAQYSMMMVNTIPLVIRMPSYKTDK